MENQHKNIKKELEELGIPLEHKPSMPHSVPKGYFNTFKKEMLEQVEVHNFIDDLPKNMPQNVPADYFEQSKMDILAEVKSLELLKGLSNKMPQNVPADFFEQSKQDILAEVKSLELLKGLPKEMPQTVPEGYFEQSKNDILAKLTDNKEREKSNKPFSVTGGGKRKNWALAASIALILSIGLLFIQSDSNLNVENELAQIPIEEIDSYINDHQYSFEAYDILENPEIITKDIKTLEEEILNATKTLSNEEIFEYVL